VCISATTCGSADDYCFASLTVLSGWPVLMACSAVSAG
jgi:hypothetical protein